jgi:peptide/nickel transport system ATP-binding protein
MALIGDPKLVIFDEPTTALDVTTQIEVLRAFKSVMKKGGIAGVYVSHDLAVVAQIADRIVVLKGGEMQEIGTTAQILSMPRASLHAQLLAAFEPKRVPNPTPRGDPTRCSRSTVCRRLRPDPGRTACRWHLAVKSVEPDWKRAAILASSASPAAENPLSPAPLPASCRRLPGHIIFDGKHSRASVHAAQRDQLRELQIVFQYADTALNPAKSIEDILGRPLTFYHGMARRARDADRPAARHGPPAEAVRRRRPVELSGGQKQRVNLARALAAEPKLILCDEITSALDTVVAAAIIDLLKELQRELGLSYIFISHDLSVVEAICDEIAVMYAGEKVEQMTPSASWQSPRASLFASCCFPRFRSSIPAGSTAWNGSRTGKRLFASGDDLPLLLKAIAEIGWSAAYAV